jgi:broad specificity phosphatase PhoE
MIPLLVIRHAPTPWSEAGVLQGRRDTPLSREGRRQAAAWRLPGGWTDAACLASPLERAMETARLIGLTPRPEPRLIEMDWGAWEGRRLKDLRTEFEEAMAANEAQGLDFRPPGGESPRDVQARLWPLFDALDGPTLAVTHKGVIRALYALATGWTMAEKSADRLAEGHAHLFGVRPDGAAFVERLNIPLEAGE